MAINLALKYGKAVQERFYRDSLTQGSFSKDLDAEFTGVKTVRLYEVETVPLNDYTRNGSNRYGEPKELEDNLQEYTMTQDKAFTFTIDKGNAKEQFNIKQAGTALKRQMREVVTPYIDKYRFQVWGEKAGIIDGISAAPTKSNITSLIMSATQKLDDALVPTEGRILYVGGEVYKLLKLADELKSSDGLVTKALGKGVVGEFDGMPVKKVPTSYLPDNVYFMIIRKDSAFSPVKLNEYKIHTDPPGISGDLAEGRVIFDAFVKGTRARGIYVAADSDHVAATPSVSIASNTATLTSTTAGATIYYTTDGTDPTYSATVKTYDSGSKPTLASGAKIRCYAAKSGMFKSAVAEGVNS